ncbi:hypothetical protein [Salibacterium sp. K-3]
MNKTPVKDASVQTYQSAEVSFYDEEQVEYAHAAKTPGCNLLNVIMNGS